jgi:hypothetical protein
MDKMRTHIRESVQDGRLPSADCLVTWFGHGRGELCAVCARRILGSEVSVECDVAEGDAVWFHAACYDLWLSVRRG